MKKHLRKLGLTLSIAALSFSAAFFQPQLHNSYLRWEVGESVVQVLAPSLRGGGTGFAVQGKSGENYILTNRHVCGVAVNGEVAIKTDNGESILKRVVYVDKEHDLCLIEGDDRFSPLELGSDPEKGDIHYAVGHPGLRQLTISQGEYIGNDIIQLLADVKKRSDCKGTVYELSPIEQFFYGMEFACLIDYKAYAITTVIYPGNSGSPLVDGFGNVIGVVFAGSNSQERDNYAVPLSEVKRVLSKF